MVGLPVARRAVLAVRALLDVVPGADGERVAHHQPAGARLPGGLENHAAGQVTPRRGHLHVRRPEAEAAGVAVEDRAYHGGAVELRQAEPLDVPAGRDERRDLTVGEEAVIPDRGERAASVKGLVLDAREPIRARGPYRFQNEVCARAPGQFRPMWMWSRCAVVSSMRFGLPFAS